MTTLHPVHHTVRQFREVLFWPVQLTPLEDGGSTHWQLLAEGGEKMPGAATRSASSPPPSYSCGGAARDHERR
jgi:hypothetical protein